jgi:hypothetical protein
MFTLQVRRSGVRIAAGAEYFSLLEIKGKTLGIPTVKKFGSVLRER